MFASFYGNKKSKFVCLIIIKLCGVLFATQVFSQFSPLVDAEIYLRVGGLTKTSLRTEIIGAIASNTSLAIGPFLTHFLFSLISIAGLAYYYASGGRSWWLMLSLLLPSSLVWTSIIGKEAVYSGALSILLVIWVRFVLDQTRRMEWVIFGIAISLCMLFRPHYTIAPVWLFFSAIVIKSSVKHKWLMVLSAWVVLMAAIYFSVWDDVLLRGYEGIEPSARASRYEYWGVEPSSLEGFELFKRILPQNAIWGIIGPLPGELLQRPVFIPFFFEGLFVLFSPCVAFLVARRSGLCSAEEFNRVFFLCLVPALFSLVIVHSPFGILNPGSATRWRTNFEPVFVLLPWLFLIEFRRSRL